MAKKLLTSNLPFQGIEGFKQTQKKSNFSLNGGGKKIILRKAFETEIYGNLIYISFLVENKCILIKVQSSLQAFLDFRGFDFP